ncbi:phytoene/squalene synthase family protein [Cohnella abietis]|uniref:Phytoene synthase n=1 Tax=Cohnella abietis TaxID=2507935 RepID=A0A3T1D6D0_9BACL|nr:phytoene/squalene synthase family protein [Cohnella abietis]BBI33632.1 phytoene synthase [Cohnella abietis]
MELSVCLAKCEKMIRTGSSSFYHAFRLLPSPRKEAVFVIYAFCRLIDNSVDEPEKSPFTLEELESQFLRLETSNGHFIWPSLRWLFANFAVDPGSFIRQMIGQRRDLKLTHYDTVAQLEEYCYLVAGTVGEMLLPVLHDHPTEHVIEAGIYLGKAMQIVNIVRDVGEDQLRGRRYLPRELMDQQGYSAQKFAEGRVDDTFIGLIDNLSSLARLWFDYGLQRLDAYPASSAFSVELAAGYYRAILDEIVANRYDVFSKRAVVGTAAKLEIFNNLKRKYMPSIKELAR